MGAVYSRFSSSVSLLHDTGLFMGTLLFRDVADEERLVRFFLDMVVGLRCTTANISLIRLPTVVRGHHYRSPANHLNMVWYVIQMSRHPTG